eukprot:scaffold141082_cov39-Attheya_sp.AAC.1
MQTLVQLYDNGEKKKGKVPTFNGGDAEAMIRTLREKCLHDIALDDWDTVRTQYPITLGGFTAGKLYSWKEMILPEDVYEMEKNYIET